MSEKNLVKQLKLIPKIICFLVGITGVHLLTSTYMGFPPMFVKVFYAFTVACFVFFVILDLPSLKATTPASGTIGLIVTFILASVYFTGAGILHPQFDPAFEIAKINRPPLKTMPEGPEAIAAGRTIFEDNKCTNCHKTKIGGSSDRGPNLYKIQIGAYPLDFIKEQIVEPRKNQHHLFDDAKSKKAMPTYYGEDITGMDMDLLLVYLQTQVNDEQMPVVGREGVGYKSWKEVDRIVADGKKMFEGELNEDINCSVCHGKDGVPLMSGAADLRKKSWVSKNHKKPLGEVTDAEWFYSVWNGVEDTAMAGWGAEMDATRYQIWAAAAYERTHFQNQ